MNFSRQGVWNAVNCSTKEKLFQSANNGDFETELKKENIAGPVAQR